ncbi:glycoside hydrolase family 1 protein [Streptobacillus felis]|uniref:Glycoside hydrolase family 1 protein n=1 Tax=Streptobacillus felis TaxID=1384509 RepID=A0A7Z0PFH6_9FUSO|nr:glycoside hydrolase family 1 protein [Streptobacillus felis]NYV28079.1 glycoside hydrolase family 1 protein [Streptobacillus felis]
MIKFPENFYWGSSISAEQSEGRFSGDGKGLTTWDKFFEVEPYKFHNGIGPETTTSMYKYYLDDVKLLKETGHNTFRTSISWARLIPNGVGEVNEEAVKFYRSYFNALKEEGIQVFVNLSHFDTPLALEEEFGGFASKVVVDAYAKYARTCFELFGDTVKTWFTFNEPIVSVECGYLKQYHYPTEVDPKKAVQVAYNIALASAKATKEFKEVIKDGNIGIILNLTPAYPRSNHPADLKAARIAELFANKSFLDPAVKGKYDEELVELVKKHDLLPEYTTDELEIISNNKVNILGINYYQPLRVKARESKPNDEAPFMPEYYYDNFIMPGRRMNPHRGWEIYPKGLYDISVNIRENYGNIPWFVAENGMGVEGEEKYKVGDMIHDDYRIEFFKEHLEWLHKGIQEGSNCKGYLVWTAIDCWSWLNAYKNRYGLIELDLKTAKRYIKKSGYWFKKLNENNGF